MVSSASAFRSAPAFPANGPRVLSTVEVPTATSAARRPSRIPAPPSTGGQEKQQSNLPCTPQLGDEKTIGGCQRAEITAAGLVRTGAGKSRSLIPAVPGMSPPAMPVRSAGAGRQAPSSTGAQVKKAVVSPPPPASKQPARAALAVPVKAPVKKAVATSAPPAAKPPARVGQPERAPLIFGKARASGVKVVPRPDNAVPGASPTRLEHFYLYDPRVTNQEQSEEAQLLLTLKPWYRATLTKWSQKKAEARHKYEEVADNHVRKLTEVNEAWQKHYIETIQAKDREIEEELEVQKEKVDEELAKKDEEIARLRRLLGMVNVGACTPEPQEGVAGAVLVQEASYGTEEEEVQAQEPAPCTDDEAEELGHSPMLDSDSENEKSWGQFAVEEDLSNFHKHPVAFYKAYEVEVRAL